MFLNQAIEGGFHDGDGTVAGDVDLIKSNIRSGKVIFGVTGTMSSGGTISATGNATADKVLTGSTFSNSSAVGINGAMTNVGAEDITPTTSAQAITAGYHNGSGEVAGDADLVAGNIKLNTVIFDVTGTLVGGGATGNATTDQVLTSRTFSNASDNGLTGTMVNVGDEDFTPTTSAQAITEGYHNGSGEVAGDADLVAGNIKLGTVIFDVTGTLAAGGSATVPKTGQTTSYGGRDDGALKKGTVWPNPRFTDNLNGTVTDNLTGLVWLQNANCFDTETWADALTESNSLADGTCNLTDGSSAEDWRLPNVLELQSLIAWQYYNPALSNDAGTGKWASDANSAFSGVQSNGYWSSTTYAVNTDYAWYVYLGSGYVDYGNKTNTYYVWPVRD